MHLSQDNRKHKQLIIANGVVESHTNEPCVRPLKRNVKKCGKAGHFAAVCRKEQIKSQKKSFIRNSFDNKSTTAECSRKGNPVASTS